MGFPNFNEFSLESIVWIERKLEITRPSVDAPLSEYQTNQMYFLAISNVLGVECWNSYSSNYTSSSQIQIVAQDSLSMMLTNEEAGGATMSPVTWSNTLANTVSLFTWPGSAPWTPQQNRPPTPNENSFAIPLIATVVLPLNPNLVPSANGIWMYVYQNHNFVPMNDPTAATNYVDAGIVPLPQFGLLTTNRLQVMMLDEDSMGNYHVIDYVQFAGPDSSRNLNAEIADYDPGNTNNGLWNTNFFGASLTTPYGVVNQIYYALNPQQNIFCLTPNDDPTWRNPPGGGTVGQEIASLNAFFSPNHWGSGTDPNTGISYVASNLNLSVQVPFTPARIAYQYTSWQANDPLVHYLASDLNFTGTEPSGLQTGTHQLNYAVTNLPANNLGQLNDRYQPWGSSLFIPNVDANGCNLAYKDPLVRMSDDWNFPTNESATGNWLGQIHRGTPWQTIYLKASDILGEVQNGANIGTNTWMNWTGDFDPNDASAMAPVRDWHMVSMLAALLNTKDLLSLFSVNNSNTNAWLILLDGMTALTNDLPDSLGLRLGVFPPQFGTIVISSNSPQAAAIVNAIQSARIGQPGRFFRDVGDILAIPQLTEQSPFLNWNDGIQASNGISDEAYEEIPSQLLPLLRADSIGSIASTSGPMLVQFTGYDGHAYAIEVSSDLKNWANISTNYPVNGMFGFTNSVSPKSKSQFYRSILLP